MKIRRPYWAEDDGAGGGGADDKGNQTDDAKGGGDDKKDVQTPLTEDAVQKMIQSATDKLTAAHQKELGKRDQKINDLQGDKMTAEEKLAAKQKEVDDREASVKQSEVKLAATKALATEGLGVEWADLVVWKDEASIPDMVGKIKKSMAESVKTQVTAQLKLAGIALKDGGGDGKSKTSTRVNPWAKATRNLTEQMKITREDPKLAAQLKAAAGT